MELTINKNFQNTFYGQIPQEWIACKFEDVLTGFSSGMTPYRGIPEYYKGDTPWITSGELNYNVITDTIEKITKEAIVKTNLKILPIGTFLMAITGLEAAGTRGSCAITGVEATTNQSCMALFPIEGKADTGYLYHFYRMYGDVLAFHFCQGSKQQSYTGKIAKILPINLPPTLEEQKAIATALSDVDNLITNLEELITKKKAIKQGAMQQLLTAPSKGGMRLDGFDGEWVEKSLGQTIKNEQLPSGLYKDKGLYGTGCKIIKLGDVFKNDYFKPDLAQRVEVSPEELSSYEVRLGDLIIALASVKLEGVGKTMLVNELNEPTIYDHNVALIRLDEKFNSRFFSHLFKSKQFREQVSSMATQVGTTFLKASSLKSFKLTIPNTLLEQKAIATILSDMDKELDELATKKEKYEHIKQGMMQELLTGKTRLV